MTSTVYREIFVGCKFLAVFADRQVTAKIKNHENFNQAMFIVYRNVVYVRVRIGVWSELRAHTTRIKFLLDGLKAYLQKFAPLKISRYTVPKPLELRLT